MIYLRAITQLKVAKLKFAKLLMCAYISTLVAILVPFTSYSMVVDGKEAGAIKTDLQQKYYQQALYYYFQGNYSAALNIISVTKLRLNSLDQNSQLFEAGLQVKVGLEEQAKQSLLAFSRMLQQSKQPSMSEYINAQGNEETVEKTITNNQYQESVAELLSLTLLSLTEQFINQGEVTQAQQTLAKITHVTPRYYPQYHVLNQLAYWPNQPALLPVALQKSGNNNNKGDPVLGANDAVYESPYIQLNKALRFITTGDFNPAIELLTRIKNRRWQAPEHTFWQSLFTTEQAFSLKKQTEAQLQNQAINDYARLLLAQLYAEQEAYEKVFVELKSFPQQSPYSESALFLFAFSAQKIKQHTTALSLLTLLHQQYPYSHLGWQASLLMAKQTTDQKGLAQGWQAYEKIEQFFIERIEILNDFEKSYATTVDLLHFSTSTISTNEAFKNYMTTPFVDDLTLEALPYEPESIWLQQALYDVSINNLYQQLSELNVLEKHNRNLKNKNAWITATVKLNTQRKARIAAMQKSIDQQGVYETLLDKRAGVFSALERALSEPQQKGAIFANEEEQALLERLHSSKEKLAYIAQYSDKSKQQSIEEYQQRLTRLSGVLTWQLKQQYPQRAWQHKQQLAELDKHLAALKTKKNKVSMLSTNALTGKNNEPSLKLMERQRKEDKKIDQLNQQIKELKTSVSLAIRTKVSGYIDEQRALLAQHLLTTRRAMANVLEQMSNNDKRIEKQLNLDAPMIEEQTL